MIEIKHKSTDLYTEEELWGFINGCDDLEAQLEKAEGVISFYSSHTGGIEYEQFNQTTNGNINRGYAVGKRAREYFADKEKR